MLRQVSVPRSFFRAVYSSGLWIELVLFMQSSVVGLLFISLIFFSPVEALLTVAHSRWGRTASLEEKC